MPVLATKADQLLDEINNLQFKSKVDEFTLLRLERETQKLLQVDPFHAYQYLGMIASLKKNIPDIHKYYEMALNLRLTNPYKIIVLSNYAASLLSVGFFSDAVELTKSFEHNLSVEGTRLINIDVFLTTGLFHKVANLIRKYDLENSSLVFEVEKFMDNHNVTDVQFQRLIEIAISILHKHQYFSFWNRIKIEFSSDESSTWLSYIIKVDRSVEEIVEMDYELACALTEEDFPSDLLLHFVPVYEVAGE